MARTFLSAPILMLAAALGAASPTYGEEGDDGPIAREVNYRLTRAEVVEQGVLVVRADGGRVELIGRVRSREVIDEAGRIAAEVEGVDEVVNRLKVADTRSGGGSGSNRHLPQGKAAEPVDNPQGQQQPASEEQSEGQQTGQQSDQQQPSQQQQQTSGQQQGGGKQPQQPSGQSQPSGQQQSGSGRQ